MDITTYPTTEEIERADRFQVCKWYTLLRLPSNLDEVGRLNRIVERYKSFGGSTPQISKALT